VPIKPENKHRYPKDWPGVRRRILERARHRCEFCGVHNGALGGRHKGEWFKAHQVGEKMLRLEWPKPGEHAMCSNGERQLVLRIVRIVLTIAHLDHVPENCSDDNLKALCQKCHLTYDAEMHAQEARITRHKRKAVAELFDA
jgi:5-methylcytosine-specific restriction endonuclease McrA